MGKGKLWQNEDLDNLIHHVKSRNFKSFFTASFKFTDSNPAHNGRVCSTWGNFHFKTFDGDIFRYPGLCNYVFASHCNTPYEEFNIQIRRTLVENILTIHRIAIKLEGVAIELTKDVVLINSNRWVYSYPCLVNTDFFYFFSNWPSIFLYTEEKLAFFNKSDNFNHKNNE